MPGASAFPVMTYNVRNANKQIVAQKKVLILGLERGGTYAGTYNVPGGKYEQKDGLYQGRANLFNTMAREMWEEIALPSVSNCVGPQRKPDVHVNQTPIWLINVQTGVSRSHFKPTNEMMAMEFIDLAYLVSVVKAGHRGRMNVLNVDGNFVTVSEYTVRIVADMITAGILH